MKADAAHIILAVFFYLGILVILFIFAVVKMRMYFTDQEYEVIPEVVLRQSQDNIRMSSATRTDVSQTVHRTHSELLQQQSSAHFSLNEDVEIEE